MNTETGRNICKWVAAKRVSALLAGLISVTSFVVIAGDHTIRNVTAMDATFTISSARNIGACLAVVAQGQNAPARLIVGTPGSNNPASQIQVGRTLAQQLEPDNTWNYLPSSVTGSPTGDLNNGYYGYNCAVRGERHVVSQRGAARAHVYRDGVVEQSLIPTLVSAGNAIAPNAAVDLNDSFVALGTPHDNGNRGRVHVWQRNGNAWQFLQVLDAGANAQVGGQFGWSVAFAGNVLLIGAPAENVNGRVYSFEYSGGSFALKGNLALAANLATAVAPRFGHSIAVDQSDLGAVFVGAPLARLNQLNRNTGTVLAYLPSTSLPSGFSLQYALMPEDPSSNEQFGTALALRNRQLIVSDPLKIINDEQSTSVGVVYRYTFSLDLSSYSEVLRLYRTSGGSDNFGWAVAFQNDGVAIGAPAAFSVNPANGNVYLMATDRLLADGFE